MFLFPQKKEADATMQTECFSTCKTGVDSVFVLLLLPFSSIDLMH